MKAFDLPSKESVDFDGTRDGIEEDDELEHLAGGLEVENWQTIAENGEDPTNTDDTEGWVDEIPLLTRCRINKRGGAICLSLKGGGWLSWY